MSQGRTKTESRGHAIKTKMTE